MTTAIVSVRRWAGGSESWVADFLNSVPMDRSIVAAIATGSAVRDRGHRRSDFDLLVVYRGPRPRLKAPMEVDVRLAQAAELDDLVAKGHEVVCWALMFGKPMYDPEGLWSQLTRRWAGRLPLPSETDAKQRGQAALTRAKEVLMNGDEAAAADLTLAALTQFVRERLIGHGIFPVSRPELPDQLRSVEPNSQLAQLLESAMYDDRSAQDLIDGLSRARI